MQRHILLSLVAAAFPLFGLTPTVTTITNVSPSPVQRGQNATITATVTPAAATGRVAFFSGAVPIGSAVLSGGTATFSTNQLPSGKNLLRATYVGDASNANSTTAATTALNVNSIAAGGNLFQQTTLTGLNDFFAIRVADMNGDGNADLIAADINSHGVTIALGNGDGTFQSPVFIATGSGTSSPRSLTIADFNLDGIPDIAVTNGSDGTISILLGTGSGTAFNNSTQTPITIASGNIIHDVLASDFNNDGFPDLVVADETGNQMAVLLGNGNGTFQAATFFTGITGAFNIAAGDFNSDGKIDVAVSSPGSAGQIFIFLANGLGSVFTAGTTITNADIGGYLVAGDFNGDGKIDIAAGNSAQTHLFGYLGNGAGGFAVTGGTAATVSAIAAGDFNADGTLDAAVTANSVSTGTAEVHYGDAAGNFVTGASVGSVPVNPQGIAVGDFNNDGHDDFVIGELGATPATIFLGVGAPATVTANAGSGQNATVNTAFGTALQALVKDNSGNALANTNVTFTAPASGASGTFASGGNSATTATNASGIATASTFTANTTSGTYNLSASAGAITNATAFSLTNNAGAANSVTATAGTPQSATIRTAFATALQATVKDSFGNPVPAANVTFTAPGSTPSGKFAATGTNTTTVATNAAGVATASTFTADNRAGSYNVNATVAGVGTPAVFALTNLRGAASNVSATTGSGQNATVGTAFGVALQATVTDVGGNVLPGITVTFTAPAVGPSGTFGGLASTSAVTNASGVATASAFTANTQAGSYTVNATVAGVASPAPFTLTNTAGAATLIAPAAGNNQSTPLGQAFGTSLQAAVVDSLGNGVAGVTVTFTSPGSGATGSFPSGATANAITNSVGVAIAPVLTANNTAGAFAVVATGAGVPGSATFQLANNPGNSSISLNASPNPSTLSQPITLTATVSPTSATGQVTFLFGTQVVGTAKLNSGQASITTNLLGPKTDLLEAEYSGDTRFPVAVSPAVSLTVSEGPTFPLVTAAGSPFPASTNPGASATGDFNGDNVPDLAIVDSAANAVYIMLGNGAGGFAAPVKYGAHTMPVALAVGDLNGDGRMDLVVANSGSGDVSVLLGNGNGTFQTAANYPAGGSPTGITIADADNDSNADVLLSLSSASLSVLFGNGDGTLGGPRPNFNGGYQLQNWFATASNGGSTSITPASGPATNAAFAYDINLGNPGSGVTARTWTFQTTAAGTGTLSFNYTYTGFHAFFAVTALLQVFADGPSGTTTITLYNPPQQNCCTSPSGGFTTSGTATINVTQGFSFGFIAGGSNFDSNSQLNGTLTITNFSAPAPPNPSFIMGAVTPAAIATGNLATIGLADLAIADSANNTVDLLFNNGDGTYFPIQFVGADVNPTALAIGDFNNDGVADIAVANTGSNDVSIIINSGGDAGFASAVNYPVGSAPVSIAATDVNGDGNMDLVVANSGSNNVSVLIGNGDGTFQPAITYPAGSTPASIVAADLNGDGHIDLAVANKTSANLTALLSVGPPATITARSGAPQGTLAGSAFALPVQVLVTDARGLPVQGAFVTFSLPTSGASATFPAPLGGASPAVARGRSAPHAALGGGTTVANAITDANGLATSPTLTANSTIGLYNITVQSGSVSVPFQLANQVPFDVPSALTFAYIVNQPLPQPQNLTVTSGTSSIPFTVSPTAGWIGVSPSSGNTPGQVSVSVNPGTLGTGLHAATVNLISPLATNSPLAVTVNLNINAQLTAPSNITITDMAGAPPATKSFSIGGTPGFGFTVAVTGKGLSVSPSSGTAPATLTITADPTGLDPGDYMGTIQINSSDGQAMGTTVTVVFQVRTTLMAAPDSFAASAYIGIPSTPSQGISVTSGVSPVKYTVTASDSWIAVDSAAGATPATVNITLNPAGLRPDVYNGFVVISSGQTIPASIKIPVTLTVPVPGAPKGLDGDIHVTTPPTGNVIKETFTLVSDNGVPIPFQIGSASLSLLGMTAGSVAAQDASSGSGSSVAVTPDSGITPALITVTINTDGLQPASTYNAALTVTSLSNIVTHNLVVNVLPPNPSLALSPPVLEVNAPSGGTGSGKFLIQNAGGGAIQDYSVAVVNPQNTPWLTVTPTTGLVAGQNPTPVQVNVDATGLTPGPYYATLIVHMGSAPAKQLPVSINITTADPIIALDFDGVEFDVRKGQGLSVSQDVQVLNLGGKAFTYTAAVVSGSEWLQLNNPQGTSSPTTSGTLTLSTIQSFTDSKPTGLYFASVKVSSAEADNSPQLFTAVLNLQNPNQVDATPLPNPTGLVFTGDPSTNPAPQTVQVFTSSKAAQTFYASPQTFTGPDIDASKPANWLGISTVSGMTSTGNPGSLDVLVNTVGLAEGVYTGGVSLSIGTIVRTVNVSLIVTSAGSSSSASPSARSATAATSTTKTCVAKSLVPTFAGGLVNNFSSQVAGPVPVTVYVVDNCGNLIPDPKKSGAPKADVTIQFSAGDPSAKTMQLTDKKHAGYTITWVPDQNADMTQVTVQAKLGNLNGSVQSTGTQQDAAAPADTQATILSGNSVVFGQVLPSTAPVLLPNATLNNLNPQQGAALAPGTVVEIFGANLTTGSPVKFHSLPLPTNLNGTSVTIGGLKAPLYYVSKTQIDAQVPYELEPGRQYEIVVNVNGTFTVPDHISLVAATPGLAATSDGSVLAEHANGKLITAAHPALADETIVLFLVGMGEVTPAVVSGMPAPTKKLTHVTTAPVVTLDNTAVPSQGIKFAGLTPGFVGLYQVNFVVPAGTKPGAHQLEVSQGSFHSNSATLPVGNP